MSVDSTSGTPFDAELLLETLRRVAQDPARWDVLLDVLPADREAELAPHAVRGLPAAEAAANRERRPGEGAAAEAREDLAWISVSSAGVVLARSAAWRDGYSGLAEAEPGRRLNWRSPDNAARVEAAFRGALSRDSHVAVRLERGLDEGPCFAIASPARKAPTALAGSDDPGAVCLLAPVTESVHQVWTAVRDSFDLTEAEVRLARRLREGLSLQQAAEALGVSINTVRTHLRSVFDKMGVRRQSDLVRALTELASLDAALTGPVAGAGPPPRRIVALAHHRRLSYREYGLLSGPTLLILHEGLGSCLLPPGWETWARAFGLRVVSIDRPGFGGSDPRPDYGFDSVARDLAEACDRLGLQDVVIAGVMSGAPFALHLAHHLGPRARAVLVCSGRPPRPAHRALTLAAALRIRLEQHPWVAEAMFAIIRARRSPALAMRLLRRAAGPSGGDITYLDGHPWIADYLYSCSGEALGRANRGPIDDLQAFRRAESAPPSLSCPVTVWHGAEDALSPLDDLLAYLAPLRPETRIFDGVGNLMALKHGEDIMRWAIAHA